ncbi:MAG: hypothetical protein WBA10_13125 [Elainellaceae cyanobacterium]
MSSDGADYLRSLLGKRAKVREAKPITLPNDSEPEPDVAVVKPLGEVYRTERHPEVADIFWVGERYESRQVMVDGVVHPVSFPAVSVEVKPLVR